MGRPILTPAPRVARDGRLPPLHGSVYTGGMAGRTRRRWDAARVRALRGALKLTQQQLAEELGVRQQTVSEWETGAYQPRGASARLLDIVAERSRVRYDAGAGT